MCDGVITSVRTKGGEMDTFSITICLHQRSALTPYMFALVKDDITRQTRDEVPPCMLFADYIVLKLTSRDGINYKLEYREILESRVFKLNKIKTVECKLVVEGKEIMN